MPIIPELHDSASSVMLALPSGVIGSRPVENETEWRFILPHLSCHTVHLSQFIDQTVSVCNEDKITHSIKRFCREELDLSNGADLPRMLRHSK